jgi:hypothetical protein
MKKFLLGLVSLLFAATAHAQWQSTTYALKSGWNSIYLHGDASYATLDTIFASQSAVQEVWRWNPNPNQVQFTTTPLLPSNGNPLFPALRSAPTAVSGASRQKQIPSNRFLATPPCVRL